MMRRLICGSVIPGCDAILEGETDLEVLELVADHARDVHGIDLLLAETVERVREALHDV